MSKALWANSVMEAWVTTQHARRLSKFRRTILYLAAAGAAGAGATGEVASDLAASVATGAEGAATGVATFGSSVLAGDTAGVVTNALGATFSFATKPRYRAKLNVKRMTVRVEVNFESTLADSPPKTVSAAPPPRAEPMPALALGRCIRMTNTTRRQTKKRMTTEAYRRKSDMAPSKGSGIDKTTPKLLPNVRPLGDAVSKPFT